MKLNIIESKKHNSKLFESENEQLKDVEQINENLNNLNKNYNKIKKDRDTDSLNIHINKILVNENSNDLLNISGILHKVNLVKKFKDLNSNDNDKEYDNLIFKNIQKESDLNNSKDKIRLSIGDICQN